MELDRLCAGIKERLASELNSATEPGAREGLLIACLYEASRTVLPALGTPKKSLEYQKAREAASELISCIAIPLVRGGGERGVAVLSELAEGCPDPLLKKKLSVYAQELLVRSGARRRRRELPVAAALRVIGFLGAAAALLYIALPDASEQGKVTQAVAVSAPEPAERAERQPAARPKPPGETAPVRAPASASARLEKLPEPVSARPEKLPEPAAESPEKATAPAPQGRVTKVRIVNDQILVPVLLKHGGVSVRLELVLDTGATKTAVHEDATGRLPIDLRSAKSALAEVADGRTVSSKIVRLDQMVVGPFSHGPMELELIPYAGKYAEHNGLLGMDFLGKHRHQIDMEHQLIRWF